ncbi:hypothetical protein [Legionella cardiaca]|uniref:Uncharacterized protein n=1 Tax=Legionella cardiaca TaxID=1071983 RepID=A0ABY8AWW4_9GAMM|nr:hypothetical protein [Legionella cardiaca]WED44229.1 hypothetical protein PXX05_05430 [Legionella cardiaca]
MNKRNFFICLYGIRHFIAFFCTLVAISLIKEVTQYLYLQPYHAMGIYQLGKSLWDSNDLFLQFIMVFNFIIKPIFLYIFIIIILTVLKEKHL